MALDPAIALSYRPPQINVPDPLEQGQRILALRGLLQQQALAPLHAQAAQEELRSQELANQEKELSLQDQQKVQQAYADAGGDLDKTAMLSMKAGVRPMTLLALRKSAMDLVKQKADTSKAEFDAMASKNDLLDGLIQPVLKETDPQKQEALWNQQLQEGVNRGLYTADEAAQHPYPGPQGVQQYALGLQTDKWATAQAAQMRAQAAQTSSATGQERLQAELPGIKAGNQVKQQEAAGTQPISPYQQAQLAATEAAHTETQRHNKIEEGQGAAKVGIERQRLGFDMGGGVSPEAQMAAEGKMAPQTLRYRLRQSPGFLTQILKVDPSFDEANIDKRYQALQEFGNTSNTKAGGQALALNTLIHHADLYMKAGEALKNGTFKPGNAVYNAVADAFGKQPPTNASLVARFFADETGKVATGGVPAEGEINGILKSLGTNASPEQIEGAGKTLLKIAAGRATPLIEKVKDAKLENVVHVLGPDAKEILQARGFDPETMKPAGETGGREAGSLPQVGDVVTVQGKKVKIKAIHGDGTFDADPVKQ